MLTNSYTDISLYGLLWESIQKLIAAHMDIFQHVQCISVYYFTL